MSKLDLKTKLYLYITKVVIEKHIEIVEGEDKKNYNLNVVDKNIAYVFENYEEYKKYFEMYLNKVDEDVINLAIYTRGKNGQIVALKGLCNYIIVKSRVKEFYESITKEQIDDIHKKGKITPLEAVQAWESNDLCVPGNYASLTRCKCDFFGYNCYECLLEWASHKLEYDNTDFRIENSPNEEHEKKLAKINEDSR